ncbi:MAG: hypothetical protein ACI8RE_002176 [Ilumatobacter sp.]|jgi:hypothetical protein
MILSAVRSWCFGRGSIGSGCEHGFAVRATGVAPWLTPHSQFSRAWRPDSLSLGGAHIDTRLVDHSCHTLVRPERDSSVGYGTADFLSEGIHHDVDVVAEDGVKAHAKRSLQLVVEL